MTSAAQLLQQLNFKISWKTKLVAQGEYPIDWVLSDQRVLPEVADQLLMNDAALIA